jgi:hypothetical protein
MAEDGGTSAVLDNTVESNMLKKRQESFSAKVWFVGQVVITLQVIGGMEVKPRPQVEQVKTDQILAYIKIRRKMIRP